MDLGQQVGVDADAQMHNGQKDGEAQQLEDGAGGAGGSSHHLTGLGGQQPASSSSSSAAPAKADQSGEPPAINVMKRGLFDVYSNCCELGIIFQGHKKR